MTYILINILKCVFIGIIWAALLIPVIFRSGGALKYVLTVSITAILCYIFAYIIGGYATIINTATLVALIALIVGWIASSAVFEREAKVKSKVIAFTCVVSAISYLLAVLVVPNVSFL